MGAQHNKKGFGQQLNKAFLSGAVLLSIVSAAFISYIAYEQERAAYVQHGESILNALNKQASVSNVRSLKKLLRYSFESYSGFSGVQKLVAFDKKYKEIFAINKAKDYSVLSGWQDVAINAARFERETKEALYFTSRLNKGEAAYLMLILDKPPLATFVKKVFFINATIIFFLAVFFLVVLSLFVKRLTKPLEDFSSMMIQAASGEKDLRTTQKTSDELVHMSESFNQMMDTSEKKRVELELSRDQAIQLARVKAEFAANVSHEIRTPLNGILGIINLLKEMGLPQYQQEFLEVASVSGDSLLQIINDVLDFSKMEAGKFELDLKDLDLRLLLEQVALLYADKAQGKGLELCLDLPTKEQLFVHGDPIRIRQIVSNLLNNAIKFTDKGHVTLSARVVSQSQGDTEISINVADTGKGIAETSLEEIFKPFGQASAERVGEYGGTGLGLTIARQLAALMEGSVSVTSVLDEGSCFELLVPLQIQSMTVEVPAGEIEALRNTSVLLVEPFDATRTYIEGMFQAWGVAYQSVISFDEALLKLSLEAGYSPDICLFNVDYEVGGMGAFFESLKQNEKPAKTKLIPMIGFASKANAINDDEMVYTYSIERPVRYEKLRMVLLGASAGHEKLTESTVKAKFISSEELQKLNVLVVEDNTTNQLVVIAMLKELGVLAEVAENGKEALRMFKNYGYDLILMDCNMPVMDGYQAAEAIRSLGAAVEQPTIIALSAKDKETERGRCLQSGMNDFLAKPFQLSELLAVLEEKLGCSLTNSKEGGLPLMSSEGSVLTDSVFKRLVSNTGSGIEQIIQSYLLDTPIYIVTLIAGMEAGDRAKSLDLAHKIKGSSRNLGADALVSICVEIEETCTKKIVNVRKIEKLSASLEAEFALLNAELEAKLDELDSSNKRFAKQNKEVVLVVDDDQSTRVTVASVLEREGYQVELGANGRDAIRLFEILRPNVIIMDAMMPIKDGFEACREIKEMPGGEAVSVLIMTGLESEKSLDLAFESGAVDFVPKPINLSVLRQRVRRLLEKQMADKHVQRLAYKDSLTGLPNRAAFIEHIHQELKSAKKNNTKTAVFFIDLDHFKNINDGLGHEAGDALLKALSGRLINCIRSGDMLARIGGDEFVVVLSNMADTLQPDSIAKSMLTALKAPFNLFSNEVFAGVSIGVATYPDDGLSKEALLKNADTAMYRAKAAGRNTYRLYNPEMSEILEQRMRIESELRKVVENEELRLHFQPKKDTKTGEIIGAEALVRWRHRLRGLVSPAEFIPVAEEVGLINEIGFWVLDTACATAKNWQLECNYYGSVAVNVSAVQMEEDNFVFLVETCLNKYELDAKYLELEVTESMVLDKTGVMLGKLNQIREMGVKVAIDDFGTGYSSFSYIKNMPANTLKLDMEFIENIAENESDMAVVDGMIVLAHNLGMTVVAEGVETQEQYDLLVAHKCDTVQGYFIGKPLPKDMFIAAHAKALLGQL